MLLSDRPTDINTVEKLFKSNHRISIENLLKCNDLIKELSNSNNHKLRCFFFQTENIKQLINMQLQNDDRLTQKKINSLFDSLLNIYNVFAYNEIINLYFTQLFDSNYNKNGNYAIGAFLELFSYAVCRYPTEIHQAIMCDINIYNLIISNIDQNCIYYEAKELINVNSYPIDLFIGNLFYSVVGKEFIKTELKGKRLRLLYLNVRDYILPDFHQKINEAQNEQEKKSYKIKIANSLELLHLFIKKKKNDHKYSDIRYFIIQYIMFIFDREDLTHNHLKLACEADRNHKLQFKVITKLQNLIIAQKDVEKVTLDDNLLINQCINYLVNFNDDLSVDTFLKISISLLDERFDQFTLLNLVEFVRRFFLKKREDISQALKIIDKFIIYSWNVFAYGKYEKQNGNQFFLIQSIILELWLAAHFPIFKKNDAEEIENFDTYLKDEFDTENDDDDELISQFGDKERFLSEIIDKWQLSDEMSNHQNLKFINNVKIWFNSNFLFSEYDPEPNNNELDLDTLFTNVSQEIMEIVNNYRLANKFPMIKPLQNIVKSEEELFLDLIAGG